MIDYAPAEFEYPTTRYSGSKRQLLTWLWEHVSKLRFQSVLDVFGGTGSVSLLFKRYGKQTHFNDILKFNQLIAKAVVENESVTVSDEELDSILEFREPEYPDYIASTFSGVFFTDEENRWLDRAVTEINKLQNPFKHAMLMASLFQACLAKRPFNLFHRANLYIRTANVKRSFGNKTTWEHPFPLLLRRYMHQYNRAIFSNSQRNRVVGGFDAIVAPNGVDLVYLDPPYFSLNQGCGTNYMTFYHFLEGLADYDNWQSRTCHSSKILRLPDTPEITHFVRKSEIMNSFKQLLERYSHTTTVLSYHNNGIPSKEEILSMFVEMGKKVEVYEKPYKYALSKKRKEELLFIAI